MLGDWGDYRVPLHPASGTDTLDSTGQPRGGFFLHGGKYPGSAGCIDVGHMDDEIMSKLKAFNRVVTIDVYYPAP
jgi:hypothetical protein